MKFRVVQYQLYVATSRDIEPGRTVLWCNVDILLLQHFVREWGLFLEDFASYSHYPLYVEGWGGWDPNQLKSTI